MDAVPVEPGRSSAAATPVVFVHGLIGHLRGLADSAAWGDTPLLAPDLPGYGVRAGIDPATISLAGQADWLHAHLAQLYGERPVHLVGHSAGGAIALLLAARHPQRVAAIVSIEGNFTLGDAFWSLSLARMTAQQVERLLVDYRANPAGWLSGQLSAERARQPQARMMALEWLGAQTGAVLQATGRAVVAETADPAYACEVQKVFARHRVHLVAGERSRAGWHVPGWAERQAASFTVVPGAGHLAMIEDPAGFPRLLARLLGIAADPAA